MGYLRLTEARVYLGRAARLVGFDQRGNPLFFALACSQAQ